MSDVNSKLKEAAEANEEIIMFFLNKKTNRKEKIFCRLENIFFVNGSAVRLQIKEKDKNFSKVLYFFSEFGEIQTIKNAASKKLLYSYGST